jgi:thioredoxin reductase
MASVLVVGAGPIGLDFALKAVAVGHSVIVVEAGLDVGSAVRSWGHVTLFSSWELNVSTEGRALLEEHGHSLPDPAGYPTGEELVTQYLEPIRDALCGKVEFRFATDVIAIGRGRVLKNSHIGDGVRDDLPFRVFIESDAGEDLLEADVVIDASGVLDTPNFMGTGGLPALGEANADDRITRSIPNFDQDGARFAGRQVLVVGGGTSAVTSLQGLLPLCEEQKTKVVWVTLDEGAPYKRIHDDPLPQRDALYALGNEIAEGATSVVHRAGHSVRRLSLRSDERITVELEDIAGNRTLEVVDHILAHVGYRPNTASFEELHVHQCYASQAPMKLGASLLATGGGGDDCLAHVSPGAETLRNPEPNFFIIGSKSYGRNSAFLLRIGYEQVDSVLRLIG